MTPPPTNRGAVASLVDVAARLVNAASAAGQDSTGQDMVKARKALIRELQRALGDVYPDPRDHNVDLRQALRREL